jgi:hypothetical protein
MKRFCSQINLSKREREREREREKRSGEMLKMEKYF